VLYSVHADANARGVQWSADRVLDTGIEYTTKKGQRLQIRFSSGPIHPNGNIHMVSRLLLMDEKSAIDLGKIGYHSIQLPLIEDMLVGAQGHGIAGWPD